MAEAAVVSPHSALASADLAARYGMRTAGVRPGLVAYTRQVWAYRHFIGAFANAKRIATYTNARLGQLWQVLTPLVNAAVYYLMFGIVLNTRGTIDNFAAYLCIGIFMFGYTQQVVLSGIRSITDNLGLIRALHFPRASLPIAATLTQLQQMVASVGVLLVIVLVSGEPLVASWIQIVPVLLLQSVFNLGLALAMARLGAKAIDLKQLMPFILRTWMYGSGVFYAVANFSKHLPEAMAQVLQANPLLVYIELARSALLASPPPPGVPPSQMWLYAAGWALVIGVGGYVYFWRGEQEYGRG
jgi:teichoic acid transport system permease protein